MQLFAGERGPLKESLLAVPGNPTVLVTHRSKKPATSQGGGATAHNARGASALVAAFRWAAELENTGEHSARFTVTKANYAQKGDGINLERSENGCMYAARNQSAAAVEAAAAVRTDHRRKAKVLEIIRTVPGQSKSAIHRQAKGNRADCWALIDELAQEGLVSVQEDGNAERVYPAGNGHSGLGGSS